MGRNLNSNFHFPLNSNKFGFLLDLSVSFFHSFTISSLEHSQLLWQILASDFFGRNLDASVELRQYQSLSQRNFFHFLTEWYSFFLLQACFFFLFISFCYSYKGLSPALYFSTSNDLSISKQLPRVCILRDVNRAST